MLTITLLGTAATMPLPDRALSTAFAACGGHGLLFDIGTGANGKSVIFYVACNIFGKDRISKMDYADLTADGDEGMRVITNSFCSSKVQKNIGKSALFTKYQSVNF